MQARLSVPNFLQASSDFQHYVEIPRKSRDFVGNYLLEHDPYVVKRYRPRSCRWLASRIDRNYRDCDTLALGQGSAHRVGRNDRLTNSSLFRQPHTQAIDVKGASISVLRRPRCIGIGFRIIQKNSSLVGRSCLFYSVKLDIGARKGCVACHGQRRRDIVVQSRSSRPFFSSVLTILLTSCARRRSAISNASGVSTITRFSTPTSATVFFAST